MDIRIIQKRNNGTDVFYYTYVDSSGKKHRKLCHDCRNLGEAKLFVSKLKIETDSQYLIRNIAADMYVLGSEHLKRRKSFGKENCPITISQKRYFIELIISDFGTRNINTLKISEIEQFLIDDSRHSGSWKNFYLDTFGNIYEETIWKCDNPVPRPKFQRFARNSKKADVLTAEEVESFFCRDNFKNHDDWLMFRIIFTCGLRLGEARALQASQFLFDYKVLVVNGFCKINGERTFYNKKGSLLDPKIRVVPVPDKILNEVKSYMELYDKKGNDYLFMRFGKPVRKEYLENVFKKIVTSLGFTKDGRRLIPHSLRFTYVTMMRRDVNIEQVQKIVGHTSPEMTEYYTRFSLLETIQSIRSSFYAANNLVEIL